MSNFHVCLIGALVTVASVVGPSTVPAEDDPKVVRARGLLKLLIEGKYEDFSAAGDETMRAKFPAEKAAQTWMNLVFQLGGYKSEESTRVHKSEGYGGVAFTLRFERGTATIRLVLNQADELSGLWLDSINPKVDYRPPAYVDQDAFREEPATVSAGRYPLSGTLSVPKKPGPHPGLVLVHGSGPHDEDETVGANMPFRDLAWGLASRGIAVLRYEKRTKKYPLSKPPADWTLDDEAIDDAVAAAELLRRQKDVAPNQVYVLGHSLGGTLAPYIAKKDGKLAGIIIMAGAARSILDLLEEQTEYLARLNGEPSPQDREALDKLHQQIAAIRTGHPEEVQEAILGAPAVYWGELHKLDQVGVAEKLSIPILILQGGRDYQVTGQDFAIWKERLGGRKSVKLQLFEDLNHLFMTGKGKSTPAEYQRAGHVDEQVIRTIAEWIRP